MRTARLSARRSTVLLGALLASAAMFVAAPAADGPARKKTLKLPDLFNQGGGAGPLVSERAQLSAELKPGTVRNGDVVTLSLRLDLPEAHYTYPQNATAGTPTKIGVKKLTGLKPLGDGFVATPPPRTKVDSVTKEKYAYFDRSVTWTRKFQVVDAAKLEHVVVEGSVRFQLCTQSLCKPPRPVSFQASARVAGAASAPPTVAAANFETVSANEPVIKPAGKMHPFSEEVTPKHLGKPHPLRLKFELKPKVAKPGDEVTVSITAKIDKGWHAFALTHPDGGVGVPVTIRVTKVHNLVPVGKGWRPDKAPELKPDDTSKKPRTLQEHSGTVTFSRKFKVAKDAKPGAIGVSGKFKYQICKTVCLFPKTVTFSLGDLTTSSAAPKGSDDIDKTPFPGGAQSDVGEGSLGWFLLAAFLGGLLLNVMPCVLPVIAIKVMSFVQQAGESRRRILTLNAVYAAGVIAVFLGLATLAAGVTVSGEKLGWGGLFQKPEFNLFMACVIFAMGLALLGVFEIPLPGFIGSAAGGAHREGLGGAFLTGVFATLLATPCTGPFMGPALAWSVKQPIAATYLVWGTMGVGMAFPYLVFGFFPQAIKLLPKPGNWMVRFKQFAGFALMGTVVFFASFLAQKYVVSLLVMMMGISLGLWMIGNLYSPTSHIKHKTTVRITALVLTVAICWFGYALTKESQNRLPWKEFSNESLNASLAENRTVLVDFTADWCLICKQNEKLALNRRETLEFVKKHDIVPLLADYTEESPVIREWLKKFGTDGVPLTVIFPADRPDKPIVLHGPYLQSTLLEKLEEAVAERQVTATDARSSVVSSP
jgi:suppressor for copper-sensitivity B